MSLETYFIFERRRKRTDSSARPHRWQIAAGFGTEMFTQDGVSHMEFSLADMVDNPSAKDCAQLVVAQYNQSIGAINQRVARGISVRANEKMADVMQRARERGANCFARPCTITCESLCDTEGRQPDNTIVSLLLHHMLLNRSKTKRSESRVHLLAVWTGDLSAFIESAKASYTPQETTSAQQTRADSSDEWSSSSSYPPPPRCLAQPSVDAQSASQDGWDVHLTLDDMHDGDGDFDDFSEDFDADNDIFVTTEKDVETDLEELSLRTGCSVAGAAAHLEPLVEAVKPVAESVRTTATYPPNIALLPNGTYLAISKVRSQTRAFTRWLKRHLAETNSDRVFAECIVAQNFTVSECTNIRHYVEQKQKSSVNLVVSVACDFTNATSSTQTTLLDTFDQVTTQLILWIEKQPHTAVVFETTKQFNRVWCWQYNLMRTAQTMQASRQCESAATIVNSESDQAAAMVMTSGHSLANGNGDCFFDAVVLGHDASAQEPRRVFEFAQQQTKIGCASDVKLDYGRWRDRECHYEPTDTFCVPLSKRLNRHVCRGDVFAQSKPTDAPSAVTAHAQALQSAMPSRPGGEPCRKATMLSTKPFPDISPVSLRSTADAASSQSLQQKQCCRYADPIVLKTK